jgi:tetratricopeptide (TPR) repeat protein
LYGDTRQSAPKINVFLQFAKKTMRVDSEKLTIILLVIVSIAIVSCSRNEADPLPSSGTSDAVGAQEKVVQADQEYAQREDLARVRSAIALLRQARTVDYGSYDVVWKLARASYYLGDHTTDEREREIAFREGIEAAKTAVQLQPDRPEGHFWLGANYGGDAENSTLAGLANVEDIRANMEKVIQLDESYQSGSAYLGLGQLYLKAPRVLGGDTNKAIGYLEKGLRFGSENALLRITLAEAYNQAKRYADARKQIQFIMQMKPHPEYVAEYKEALADANKLSQEIDVAEN